MTVRVRMFAAVREAAGTGETTVTPGPLDAALDVLRERYGPVFAQRLAISTVLVDGQPTPQDAPRSVPDGAEVAVLPPVSGGAVPAPPAGVAGTRAAVAAGVVGAGAAGAASAGH